MANKKFWGEILAMVLVFGMAVISCDTGSGVDGNNSNIIDPRTSFFGTWIFVEGNESNVNPAYFVLTIDTDSIKSKNTGHYWSVDTPVWAKAKNEMYQTKSEYPSGFLLSGIFATHSITTFVGDTASFSIFINEAKNKLVFETGGGLWLVLTKQ